MKRLLVAAHRSEREELLHELQRLGVVEIQELDPKDLEEGARVVKETPGDELLSLEDKLGEVRYVLDFLDRHFPPPRTLIEQFAGSKVPIDEEELEKIGEFDYGEIYQECRRLDEALTELNNKKSRLQTSMEQVEPWLKLDISLDAPVETDWVRVLIGSIALRGEVEAASELKEAVPESCWVEVDRDRDRVRLVIIIPRDEAEKVQEILARYDYTPAVLPRYGGTAQEFYEGCQEEIARLDEEGAKVIEAIKELVEYRFQLRALYDYLGLSRDRLLAATNLVRTEKACLLEGWVKEEDVDEVVDRLEGRLESAAVQVRDPEPDEETPVALDNGPLSRPFEVLMQLYSLPTRFQLDPTGLVAFFFGLFFAMAMTDAGYGIMLAAICFILLRKVHMSPLGERTFQLLFLGGLATIVAGVLSGGWWGDNIITIKPLWFSPSAQPLTFLLLSFGLGIVHLYVGMALGFYENVRKGDILAGIYDQVLWMVLVGSLILWVAAGEAYPGLVNIAKWAAIISSVGIILTGGREHKNILVRLAGGIYSLYNVSGYLSDILSYSRLLGLGMATGIIANVINIVAMMVFQLPVIGPIGAVLILVGGHLFNLFISVVGSYVHCSRLQYVEFFGKFYEGGGRAFAPFAPETKYVYLEE
jgi:V/A-type H+-transporting ATPase subunit I